MSRLLNTRDRTSFRPAPVPEEWHPHSNAGIVGVRIATMEDDRPSTSEWIWSSQWLDLTAKR